MELLELGWRVGPKVTKQHGATSVSRRSAVERERRQAGEWKEPERNCREDLQIVGGSEPPYVLRCFEVFWVLWGSISPIKSKTCSQGFDRPESASCR